MAQLINETKRMQQLAGLITESQLNEDKIPFFHLKQVLTPFGIDRPKADQMADLKVGLNVLPKKAYRDESDVKAALGKITKIEGDNITIKKVNGKEENYKKSDLFHLIDGGYQFESQVESQLSESLPMGKSKLAQDAANALNSIIGKIEMPNLSQEARVAASKIISLIDQDQNMEESLDIESTVNEALAKVRKK